MTGSISTITLFRFGSFTEKAWAFFQMQFAHSYLVQIPGLQFYKLMGSGRDLGFNPLPDWGVYALLATWKDEDAANQFFSTAKIFQRYMSHSMEQWTIFMKTSRSKGLWSGANPFPPSTDLSESNPLIAVITRATIRPSKLVQFWRYVPTSWRPIQHGCAGLIYTKGIGEVPLLQMATFSLWENVETLQNYAYKSPEHQRAIQKTRQLNWYKEEMFVRFQPYRSVGTWGGKDILGPYL